VVVSHQRYSVIPGLFLTVPLTSTDPGLRHHVAVSPDEATGLARVSYAMTEQIRALAYDRIECQLDAVDPAGMNQISRYVHLFIGWVPRLCLSRRTNHASGAGPHPDPGLQTPWGVPWQGNAPVNARVQCREVDNRWATATAETGKLFDRPHRVCPEAPR
jgi:mRNA-degrading endonuclease toxin of MazEF toxin-antitoxin module